jgi:hypothetical protein
LPLVIHNCRFGNFGITGRQWASKNRSSTNFKKIICVDQLLQFIIAYFNGPADNVGFFQKKKKKWKKDRDCKVNSFIDSKQNRQKKMDSQC